MKKTYEIAILCLAIIAISFLVFFKLGEGHLTNWDEAWYADIARNMAETGNIITPIWNNQAFFDKPPLYFWLSAVVFKVFSPTEFSARFLAALSGLGIGILVYSLGRTLFNKEIALLSLIIFFSTIGFLYRTRTGNLDSLLTFWILLSIYSFYKGYLTNSKIWFYIWGVSLGFGFLTKGVISLLFPIVAGLYLLFNKEYKIIKSSFFLKGIILGLIIPFVWILISFSVNGQQFISELFFNQTGKFSTTLSFWENFSLDYVGYLKNGLKFWFIAFIPSFFYTLLKWRNTNKTLLFIYFISIFIMLTFSENKSNWFLVPLYPIISLMIGFTIYDPFKKILKDKLVFAAIVVIVLIATYQNFIYRNEYFVPDIAGDEARVALAAQKLTEKNDVLYLTNYYYPTTIYYSQRKTYAIYSEHEKNQAWWIKPKTDWENILRADRVFIITTDQEFENLNTYFSKYKFQLLYQSGTKKLLKKV